MSQKYINYQLVAPFLFEKSETEVEYLKNDEVLVSPTLISICNADLRYFTGKRRKADLKKKLPMALIHEGVGKIVEAKGDFAKNVGKKAILIPNIPCFIKEGKKKTDCEICSNVGENYCPNSVFLSSGHDGFLREMAVLPKYCVLPYPASVLDEVAVFSEPISVINNLFRRIDTDKNANFLVYGDGPVAYLVATFLSEVRGVSKKNLMVAGIDDEKLKNFDFCTTINTLHHHLAQYENQIDVVVECIGGNLSKIGINRGIDIIKPGGTIALVGVSEKKVPINTRDILAKCLTLKGTSRSERRDYEDIVPYLSKKTFIDKVLKVIYKKFDFNSVEKLSEIFKIASDKSKYWGKILIKMNK